MDRKMAISLDRHITGNWGEDSVREFPDVDYSTHKCSNCGKSLNGRITQVVFGPFGVSYCSERCRNDDPECGELHQI